MITNLLVVYYKNIQKISVPLNRTLVIKLEKKRMRLEPINKLGFIINAGDINI